MWQSSYQWTREASEAEGVSIPVHVRVNWTFCVTHDFFQLQVQISNSNSQKKERTLLAHTPGESKTVLAIGMIGFRGSNHLIFFWLFSSMRATFSGNHALIPAMKGPPSAPGSHHLPAKRELLFLLFRQKFWCCVSLAWLGYMSMLEDSESSVLLVTAVVPIPSPGPCVSSRRATQSEWGKGESPKE